MPGRHQSRDPEGLPAERHRLDPFVSPVLACVRAHQRDLHRRAVRWTNLELARGRPRAHGPRRDAIHVHPLPTGGKPFPGVELKIADDGEILVKSPGNMLGYHENAEATAETLKDGWIYTGDIGEIDAEGFLHITDRKKALFKTAVGKYIAPQPLEFGLMRDPLVERAVIVGEGRPYVTALVVPGWETARKGGLDEAGWSARMQ